MTLGAPIEDQPRAVAILHIGGMDDDVQEKAERVDKDIGSTTVFRLPRAASRVCDSVPHKAKQRINGDAVAPPDRI
jgi:hypothetical protein